ncbi:hypothetical protein CVS40_2883 [Lucilia cuprina]|nr:hypothetical protein CVS40_2883 [Lucilia cuprina]
MALLITYQLNWQLFLLLLALPSVYPQNKNNNTTACSSEARAAKTIFEFWRENNKGCDFDAANLYKIQKKISLKQNNEQITNLIGDHISSSLMDTLFQQLIATISTKSLSSKPELENVINQLYTEQDKTFIQKIWQKVIDESLQFMNIEDILQQLILLTNGDLKLNILEYILNKYEKEYKSNPKFLPLLTFGVATVLKQRHETKTLIGDPSIGRLLSKLPEQLLTIYQSWNYNVSLLNRHYNEFIYPERNSGPAANKRYLFNFLPTKNYYRVKGKFKLQFNPQGLLTFGAPYDNSYKYLTAEKNSAFICITNGLCYGFVSKVASFMAK